MHVSLSLNVVTGLYSIFILRVMVLKHLLVMDTFKHGAQIQLVVVRMNRSAGIKVCWKMVMIINTSEFVSV